jgi:hypothetical protein
VQHHIYPENAGRQGDLLQRTNFQPRQADAPAGPAFRVLAVNSGGRHVRSGHPYTS